MDVTLGIITWNAKDLLDQLLESIRMSVNDVDYEVFVVDNGSQDGTIEMVEKEYPEVRLHKNPTNEGVALARNRLLRESKGRYLISLDVDTTVYPDAVETLVRVMDENPDVAIGGPKLVYKDGSLQLSCRPFPSPLNILLEGTFLRKHFSNSRFVKAYTMEEWDHGTRREVDWMYGACLVVRRSVLHKLGVFDPKFFYLYEDIDLCHRARDLGMKVMYIPEAVICHHLEREERSIFNKTIFVHVHSILRYLALDYYGLGRFVKRERL